LRICWTPAIGAIMKTALKVLSIISLVLCGLGLLGLSVMIVEGDPDFIYGFMWIALVTSQSIITLVYINGKSV